MASVRKHKASKFWYACITLPSGKRKQFSTGKEDEDDALAIAVAAENATKRHVDKPHQLRRSLSQLADEFLPADAPAETPAKWIVAWAAGTEKEVGKKTFEHYTNTAKECAAWFTENGVKNFDQISTALLIRLRNHWSEKNSAVTANTKVKHLRIAFGNIRNLFPENPAAKVPKLVEEDTIRRPYSDEEITLLLPELRKSPEWNAMFWLGLNTGQRLNDLAVLPKKKIDMVAHSVTFKAAKTDKLVSLPLLPAAIKALEALPMEGDGDAPVFPEIAAMKESTRSNAFRRILSKVGLARKLKWKSPEGATARQSSELVFHSLRHNATSWLKAAGVADSIAREIVGHSSVAMSRVYTHIDIDTMRREMERVPQLRELAG